MWLNYLKIAWRNLLKYKIFSSLNVGGLAVGMAVAILIGSYIQHELEVNRWIPAGDRIYRVYRQHDPAAAGGQANTPAILATELVQQFPAVEQATYLTQQSDLLFAGKDKSLYLDDIAFVDSSFLEVFELPLLQGNPAEALRQPGSVVLSETVARQFFNEIDVVGRNLRLNDELNLTITAVYRDLNESTHLDYRAFLRIPYEERSWLAYRFETYVRTVADAPVAELEAQITEHLKPVLLQAFTQANFEITESDLPAWRLQALQDVYLHSNQMGAIRASRGNASYLYIFGFIGLLVLVIAAINYVNLSTARAANRAREIGVRKVTGARQKQLIWQFLTESVLQSALAAVLAIPLASTLLPLFNQISGRTLSLAGPQFTALLLPLLALSLLVGVFAGMYPALVLSGFQPVKVLKGDQQIRVGGNSLRKVLVVTQFTGVVVLVILTTVMYRQLRYMLHQDLGFSAEQVMVLPLNTADSWRRIQARTQSWTKEPGLLAVSAASRFPGDPPIDYTVEIEGLDGRYRAPEMVSADAQYADVLGLQLMEGRFFSPDIASDTLTSFVVNQAFVKTYELDKPVGTRIRFPWRESWGEIVGVVKDYHYEGLDNAIQPMAFYGGDLGRNQVAVRFQPQQWEAVLDFLRREWPAIEPAHPFRYSFLDEQFAVQYAAYEKMGRTFLYSAVLTVLVAVLGLFGLATFTAQKRTREIGIRKVLGAGVGELTGLLVRQFATLALIAGLVAVPVAFWLARRWLMDFAYQAPLGLWPFLLGIALALGVTLLTVSLQSWRTAALNPVESLRSE